LLSVGIAKIETFFEMPKFFSLFCGPAERGLGVVDAGVRKNVIFVA
jgi:hypothetical protein